MYLEIDLGREPPVVTLQEPDDCSRLHVAVVGGDDRARVFGALVDAAAGRLEGEHAWITIDALRRMAAGRVGDDWDARFDGMLAYARTKGWLDDTGNLVRAHVELR